MMPCWERTGWSRGRTEKIFDREALAAREPARHKRTLLLLQRARVCLPAHNHLQLQLPGIWCPLPASMGTALIPTHTYIKLKVNKSLKERHVCPLHVQKEQRRTWGLCPHPTTQEKGLLNYLTARSVHLPTFASWFSRNFKIAIGMVDRKKITFLISLRWPNYQPVHLLLLIMIPISFGIRGSKGNGLWTWVMERIWG